jgi:hypothetical protein
MGRWLAAHAAAESPYSLVSQEHSAPPPEGALAKLAALKWDDKKFTDLATKCPFKTAKNCPRENTRRKPKNDELAAAKLEEAKNYYELVCRDVKSVKGIEVDNLDSEWTPTVKGEALFFFVVCLGRVPYVMQKQTAVSLWFARSLSCRVPHLLRTHTALALTPFTADPST